MDYGISSEVEADDERKSEWERQREERGFDDTEIWNLDQTFAKIIVPRLKRYKEVNPGYPGNLTAEKWDEYIQEMIDGFEEVLRKFEIFETGREWDYEKAKKGIDRFAEYYLDLWW